MHLCDGGDGRPNRAPGVVAVRAIGMQPKFELHRKAGGCACQRRKRHGLIEIVLLFGAAPRRESYQRSAFAGRANGEVWRARAARATWKVLSTHVVRVCKGDGQVGPAPPDEQLNELRLLRSSALPVISCIV